MIKIAYLFITVAIYQPLVLAKTADPVPNAPCKKDAVYTLEVAMAAKQTFFSATCMKDGKLKISFPDREERKPETLDKVDSNTLVHFIEKIEAIPEDKSQESNCGRQYYILTNSTNDKKIKACEVPGDSELSKLMLKLANLFALI